MFKSLCVTLKVSPCAIAETYLEAFLREIVMFFFLLPVAAVPLLVGFCCKWSMITMSMSMFTSLLLSLDIITADILFLLEKLLLPVFLLLF